MSSYIKGFSTTLKNNQKKPGESESTTDIENQKKRNQSELRKTNEQNTERQKKGPKTGPNVIILFSSKSIRDLSSVSFFSLGSEVKKLFLNKTPLI